MQYVYVLNKHGEPLMPCSPRKARLLLKQKKACVIKRTPFTVKLLHGSAGYKQPVTLGVDAGSKHIGISATTEKHELYREEATSRNDVVDLLSARRAFRRSRRNRKTRYRAPRFNNRVHSKHKGWLAPSVEVKIQEHITLIKHVFRILPVTLVRVETAKFDTQRLKAMLEGKPLPVGTDYQLGEMYDEYNVRQYVLKRDNYTCQCCGAHSTKTKGVKLHVHHIETRRTGGNAPNNLITLCKACHKALHAEKVTLDGKKRGKSLKDAAFMGIMRKTLMLSETSSNAETHLRMGQVTATSIHQGEDKSGNQHMYSIELADESDGTRKLMALAPAIESVLSKGGLLLIDGIEKDLHQALVEFIIAKFQSKKTNPKGAQLVFTTHNTELLSMELLRKDQLYFVDKHKDDGASELYSISNFSTRTTDNIRKGYLLGKYGATPNVEIEEIE